jgi:hypothetical protein
MNIDYQSRLETAFFAIFRNNNLLREITKHQRGKKYYNITPEWAAKNGHLSWLEDKFKRSPFRCSGEITTTAAEHGHIHILDWLREKDLIICTKYTIKRAVVGGLNVIKWIHQWFPVRYGMGLKDANEDAVYKHRQDIVVYMRQHLDNDDIRHIVHYVIYNGDIKMLKCLDGGRFDGDFVIRQAANWGKLDILEYLYQQGYKVATDRLISKPKERILDLFPDGTHYGYGWTVDNFNRDHHKDVDVIKTIHEKYGATFSMRDVTNAIDAGCYSVAKYIANVQISRMKSCNNPHDNPRDIYVNVLIYCARGYSDSRARKVERWANSVQIRQS